jgi:purine nucleosidase/ribosylpyrimidine nucleosidase
VKVILDVDTGTDDAVAIMLAALHPDLELIAVTTVNGNVPLENTTDNTLRTLDFIGRGDIPVYPGRARPLVRHDFPGRKDYGGATDMHGLELPIPAPASKAQDTGAVEFLVETFRSSTEPITLVPTGPLSNIGAAVAVAPDIVEKVHEVVIMGGGYKHGNITPAGEFNIWADPEAADMTLTAGFDPLTLVPLDATHQALVTRDDVARFDSLGTPAGTAAARFVGRRIDAYSAGHRVETADAAPVHDALCIAYLVDRDVIETRHLHVRVETQGELNIGRTVIDTRSHADQQPNAHVAFAADARRFVELMMTVFSRTVTV